ncbi:hypothetical protein TRIP_B50422 [uncultured Desulfatiglans sp.]|nr:hypothetical protein TRIP_B50422 [uncultured Desulfatiglans sp.]
MPFSYLKWAYSRQPRLGSSQKGDLPDSPLSECLASNASIKPLLPDWNAVPGKRADRMDTNLSPSGKKHPARQPLQSVNEGFSSHPSGAQSPPAGRVPVSSHPSGAQSRPSGAAPGPAHVRGHHRLPGEDL